MTPDASRGVAVQGGSSLRFSYESPAANGVNYTNITAPAQTTNNTYDFPGGAAGAVESQTFDLSGLAAGDLPTLYFNYRFDTEQANAALPIGQSPTDYMRDSLRVYASGESGEWMLLATNNTQRGPGSLDDEFDPLVTAVDVNGDGVLTGEELQNNVQELFDNNGQWRQARVPLDAFAGQSNVRLRIEFSSAGGFGFGMNGGKGPQLRTLAGNRLVDGQTFTIGGRTFELEMGPSLSMPSGSAVNNGDSVTIEGVTYVFTNGTGAPVVAPNVAVPFNASQSAETLASSLLTAIQSTPRPKAIVNLNATEQNDTMTEALVASLTGDSATITVTGNIGDNPALSDPTADVDLVRLDLARGTTVDAQVNALFIGSALDSYLRVFDSNGNELAFNDNRFGSTDSRILFTAPSDGTYYFGVSGSSNTTYFPSVFRTGTGSSSGNYQLVLDVTRQLNPVRAGARLQLEGASAVSVSPGASFILQGALGTSNGNDPVYVNVGMTAAQVATAVQASMITAYNGNTNTVPVRGDTIDLTGLVQYDSFNPLNFLPTPSLSELDPGPFGASTSFVGDEFGAFNASTDFNGNRNALNPGALRASNNGSEGVFLDDFIIGVAGRGEMVQNAPVDPQFIVDPQLTSTLPISRNLEIMSGPYQLEIRGGKEYAVPLLDGFPTTLFLEDAVSPQEQESDGVAIRFNPASLLTPGATFEISDGTRSLTFELDNIDDAIGTQSGNVPVPFSTAAFNANTGTFESETSTVITARIRDIINSSAVQSVLDIKAVLLNSDAVEQRPISWS